MLLSFSAFAQQTEPKQKKKKAKTEACTTDKKGCGSASQKGGCSATGKKSGCCSAKKLNCYYVI